MVREARLLTGEQELEGWLAEEDTNRGMKKGGQEKGWRSGERGGELIEEGAE